VGPLQHTLILAAAVISALIVGVAVAYADDIVYQHVDAGSNYLDTSLSGGSTCPISWSHTVYANLDYNVGYGELFYAIEPYGGSASPDAQDMYWSEIDLIDNTGQGLSPNPLYLPSGLYAYSGDFYWEPDYEVPVVSGYPPPEVDVWAAGDCEAQEWTASVYSSVIYEPSGF
jgi:hypothetical protein